MERHENVVQGATDRREERGVPSSFDKYQSAEERKRTDPQRVKRANPQRVGGERDPASHRAGRGRPGQDAPPRRHLIFVADTSSQDGVEDAQKTVEVPQMHDIDKIVRRRFAGTEDETPKGDETAAMKTADAHPVQYIDRVADIPVDKEPGEVKLTVEDTGSCCTKCYSDVEPVTDIPPGGVDDRCSSTDNRKPCGRESNLQLSFGGEAVSGSPGDDPGGQGSHGWPTPSTSRERRGAD